jgi:hypothetical protein
MKLDYDVYSSRGYTELFRVRFYKAEDRTHSAESLFILGIAAAKNDK